MANRKKNCEILLTDNELSNMKEGCGYIQAVIYLAEGMRESYLIKSPTSYPARVRYAREHTRRFYSWREGGNDYTIEFYTHCTKTRVYANGYYTRNGKMTRIETIKSSLNRLYAIVDYNENTRKGE